MVAQTDINVISLTSFRLRNLQFKALNTKWWSLLSSRETVKSALDDFPLCGILYGREHLLSSLSRIVEIEQYVLSALLSLPKKKATDNILMTERDAQIFGSQGRNLQNRTIFFTYAQYTYLPTEQYHTLSGWKLLRLISSDCIALLSLPDMLFISIAHFASLDSNVKMHWQNDESATHAAALLWLASLSGPQARGFNVGALGFRKRTAQKSVA